MLVLGCGLLPFLRLARTRRELLTRAPLGYAVGLAATGILGADLAVVYVPVGRVLLPVLAAVSLFLGLRRVPGGRPAAQAVDLAGFPRSRCSQRRSSSRCRWRGCSRSSRSPSRDGWEIWAARARALYEFGHPARAGLHRPDLPGASASAAPAWRSRRSTSASWARSTARLVHLQLLGARGRLRRRGLDAPAGHDEADPARRDAARARRDADVLQPAADELRRHPARDVHRARGRCPRELAAHRRRRACCRRRRSSSPPAR